MVKYAGELKVENSCKSSATKTRREPSAANQRKTAVKMSAGIQNHQRSHEKKPATSAKSIQPIYSSTSMDIDAAGKDTALPSLPFNSDSAPLPSITTPHQRKRSKSEYSCAIHMNCNRKHRYVVSHDYHDHASTPSIEDNLPINIDDGYFGDDDDAYQPNPAHVVSTTTTRGSHPGSKSETFPFRLYRMIEDAHAEGNSDIIHFMPHGRAFIVEDHDKLVNKLLNRYFQQSKYVSFQRQLNIYGFQKLTVGTDQGEYMCIERSTVTMHVSWKLCYLFLPSRYSYCTKLSLFFSIGYTTCLSQVPTITSGFYEANPTSWDRSNEFE